MKFKEKGTSIVLETFNEFVQSMYLNDERYEVVEEPKVEPKPKKTK